MYELIATTGVFIVLGYATYKILRINQRLLQIETVMVHLSEGITALLAKEASDALRDMRATNNPDLDATLAESDPETEKRVATAVAKITNPRNSDNETDQAINEARKTAEVDPEFRRIIWLRLGATMTDHVMNNDN